MNEFTATTDKIVYKVAITPESKPALIELKLPAYASRIEFEHLCQTKYGRYSLRKLGRASAVDVNDIWLLGQDLLADDSYTLREAQNVPLAVAAFDLETVYQKGYHVIADAFDRSPVLRCSNGIHYFDEKDVAICYAVYDIWFQCRVKDHMRQQRERVMNLWRKPDTGRKNENYSRFSKL